ncbi:hypothetical protein [Calothrix sp. 336/3]|uniref:hypothetical protein n=1 Tax=Calothrix sp. 336/3 TaxID=1337936 RepID=UPI0004E3C564|nr:hypothetical protein [Calothrix sp. 336/3]AKG23184.1 hypothetical protein IJ00_19600 [Calothrix sp. 336/3]
MVVRSKYFAISTVSLSISLLLASCNPSKQSQCEQLITAVNQGTILLDKNKGSQVTTSVQLANDLQATSKKIQELNIQDPKLKRLQSDFATNFRSLSQHITKAAKALSTTKAAEANATGRSKIQQARNEIDNSLKAAAIAAKKSDTLAVQLNKYCSQKVEK